MNNGCTSQAEEHDNGGSLTLWRRGRLSGCHDVYSRNQSGGTGGLGYLTCGDLRRGIFPVRPGPPSPHGWGRVATPETAGFPRAEWGQVAVMVYEPTSESGGVLLGGCPGVDTVKRGAFTGPRGAIAPVE